MKRLLASLAGALLLTACATVGPDYRSPEAQAPAQAPFAGAGSPIFSGDQPSGPWWTLFADPVLDGLVRDALANNTDLRVASANLSRARAALRELSGDRSPTGSIGSSASTGRQSALGLPGGATRGEIFDAGLDVGYQVDLVGGIRRGIEAYY